MNKPIKIVASRQVSDGQALLIRSASYQGSAPFDGVFEVWDLDHCCRTDPETGGRLVDIVCHWQDDASEDPTMTLTVHDPLLEGCIGFEGEVVARLDYA